MPKYDVLLFMFMLFIFFMSLRFTSLYFLSENKTTNKNDSFDGRKFLEVTTKSCLKHHHHHYEVKVFNYLSKTYHISFNYCGFLNAKRMLLTFFFYLYGKLIIKEMKKEMLRHFRFRRYLLFLFFLLTLAQLCRDKKVNSKNKTGSLKKKRVCRL